MIGRTDDHIQLFLDCLEKQTLKNFEAIIADCYYKHQNNHVKNNTYKGKTYPFTIHHFQVKSPWLDRGCWAGQAPWNQSTMIADGELLCLFGDCCEPPENYLQNIWDWYKKGFWSMGLVIYKKNGRLFYINEEDLQNPIPDSDIAVWNQGIIKNVKILRERGVLKNLVRDSRWPFVENSSDGIVKLKGIKGGQQFHGYSSIPANALLEINGFDENFDGDKALGDTDFGIRLAQAGYDRELILDKDTIIYENAHYGIPEKLLFYEGNTIRSNYSLMILNQNKGRFKANDYHLSPDEVDWIHEHAKDWGFRDIDQRKNPLFKWWIENPPIFNLRELRWEVQEKMDNGIIEIPEYYGEKINED